ncbi:hypothetical protein D9M69_655480 [compost metagenome]
MGDQQLTGPPWQRREAEIALLTGGLMQGVIQYHYGILHPAFEVDDPSLQPITLP